MSETELRCGCLSGNCDDPEECMHPKEVKVSKSSKKVTIEIRDADEETGEPLRFKVREGDPLEGKSFISVRMWGNSYGSSSPCLDESEVQSSIKHAKEWVMREGDVPVVIDHRKSAKLNAFIGKESKVLKAEPKKPVGLFAFVSK